MATMLDRVERWIVGWRRVAVRTALVLVGLGPTLAAVGQTAAEDAAAMPAQTLEGALHEMSDAAGVIFAGQVMAVRRVSGGESSNPSSGVVEVVFRVDQAVRGCVAGESYVLREWAGLWANGEPRYRVGQRLLMLLRAPGVGGLSSPVGGMDGAIPIRGAVTEITASGANVSGAAAAAAPVQMVDLRWVGTRMLRLGTAWGAGLVSGTAVSGTAATSGAASGSAVAGSVAAQGASVDTVVGMLGAWEQTRAAR